MTNIQAPTIIDRETLIEVVTTIWDIMFDTHVEPDPTVTLKTGPSASISICGPWTATLVATLDPTLAAQTAAALLLMPADEIETADMHDVLGEIVNIAGGNLKGLFDSEVALSLSLPVVSDSELKTQGEHHDSLCARFNVAGLPMLWQLHYVAPLD